MPGDPASEPAEQKITDVGTTCYRPPELLFGHKAYDCSIDIWAAGCVVAETVHAIDRATASRKDESEWTLFDAPDWGSTIDRATAPRKKKESEWTLFDAGELGSELALVKSIFETLGTPDEEIWPEAAGLPDWGKMSFVRFSGRDWYNILPCNSSEARDLVSKLVRYQSTERLSAAEVGNMKSCCGWLGRTFADLEISAGFRTSVFLVEQNDLRNIYEQNTIALKT